MAFRNAAFVVIARVFKLVTSSGFITIIFGPKTRDVPIYGVTPGQALEYESSLWDSAGPLPFEAGVFFGSEDTATPQKAIIQTYTEIRDTDLNTRDVTATTTNVVGKFPGTFSGRSRMDATAIGPTSVSAVIQAVADSFQPEGSGVSSSVEVSATGPVTAASLGLYSSGSFVSNATLYNMVGLFNPSTPGTIPNTPVTALHPNIANSVDLRCLKIGAMTFIRVWFSIPTTAITVVPATLFNIPTPFRPASFWHNANANADNTSTRVIQLQPNGNVLLVAGGLPINNYTAQWIVF